jgi:hypothetical protein
MDSSKIIVVVGATGNQGSSVAHTFLKLPGWHVRCVSRNPSSPASLSLASLGAEVVRADLSDASSLGPAFSNANAIFLNTDFWETYRSPETATLAKENGTTESEIAFKVEVSNGKNAAHAAAAVSVIFRTGVVPADFEINQQVPSLECLVYSTLPHVSKLSNGKYTNSRHSITKGTVVDYILEEEPQLAKKTSYINLGGYNTNAMFSPKLDPSSGRYSLITPFSKDQRIPIIDPLNSTGPFVRALIEDEDPGTTLLAYDSKSYLAMGEIANLWSKASGKEVDYVEVSVDILHQKFGLSKEMLDGPAALKEFGYMGKTHGFIEPHQLKKQIDTKSFETWLNERNWAQVLGGS